MTISKGLNVVQMGLLLLYYCNCFISEKNSFGSLSLPVLRPAQAGLRRVDSLQSKHLQPDYVSSHVSLIFSFDNILI